MKKITSAALALALLAALNTSGCASTEGGNASPGTRSVDREPVTGTRVPARN